MNKIKAEDLYKLKSLGDIEISPNGEQIAYSISRVNKKTEKKHSNIWLSPFKSGKAKQLTFGNNLDTQCKWSPDSKQIAFLSTQKNEKQSQIFILPSNRKKAKAITKFRGTITIYDWSPDGKQILFGRRKLTKEEKARQDNKRAKELGIVERHIKKTMYKVDGEGFLSENPWHIWTANSKTGKCLQLTKGEFSCENASWSADGKRIVYTTVRSLDPSLDPKAKRLFTMSSNGRNKKEIPLNCYHPYHPTFSPNGEQIAFYAFNEPYVWWKGCYLWVVNSNGKGRAKNILEQFDVTATAYSFDDIRGMPIQSPPIWSPKGDKIYLQIGKHGNEHLMSVDVATRGRELKPVYTEKGLVHEPSMSKDGSRFAFGFSTSITCSEVFALDLEKNKASRRSNINTSFLNRKKLASVEEVWTGGKVGKGIHGWIMKPPGFRKSKKYPAILEIHGGPHAQYSNGFMHEFHYLAAAGYVVFFSNPRGSTGYGAKHTGAIANNWGNLDYKDIMSWTDYATKLPYIDSKRLGVTGGSYGGFMTNWIIGKTKRFKAAVTQRCISTMSSMWGMSDFNWHMQHCLGDKAPWEDHAKYWKHSPLKYVANVKTPCLIIHSQYDLRCPQGEGEQWYVALKRLGVDAELVIFPDESHGLSRGGRTDRRIRRLEHIKRWFDSYL